MSTTLTAVPYAYTAITATNLVPNPQARPAANPGGWAVAPGSGGSGTLTGAVAFTPTEPGPPGVPVTTRATWVQGAAGSTDTEVRVSLVANSLNAGEAIAAGVYARPVTARSMRAGLIWLNASGVEVGRSLGPAALVGAGAWARLSVIDLAPAGARTALLIVAGRPDANERWRIAAPFAQSLGFGLLPANLAAAQVPAYFDGDTGASVGVRYNWTGTAHASTSVRTYREPSASLAVQVTPRLVTEYDAGRSAEVTVHRIIGRPDPIVTRSSAVGLRSGTLQIWCEDDATAQALVELLRLGTFMVTSTDAASLAMYAEATGTRAQPTGDEKTRWLVAVEYVEVLIDGDGW